MTPNLPNSLDAPVSVARTRRVLIVDDHARTLAAVAAVLQQEYPRIDVIGTAGNCHAALRNLHNAPPDVVVLDLDLGEEDGLDLMPAIDRHPGIEVIILSASDDPEEAIRALGAGALAFISKFSPVEELIAAIVATRPEATGAGALSCATGSADPCK